MNIEDIELLERCYHLFGFEKLKEITGRTERQITRYRSGDSEITDDVVKHLQNALQSHHNNQLRPLPKGKNFRFIDLFAGIGGIRKGFEGIGGECVFSSEWDKYARMTYLANYGDKHPLAGDITQVTKYLDDVPNHDVLLAGFPCQPFSIAGVSKKNSLGRTHGFDCDTQGTLFFEIEKILSAKQPAAFLLENVKNLKSHDKGRTFKVIEQTLTDKISPGYNIYPMIVDAKGVVPQHRERVFIVGFRKDLDMSLPLLDFNNEWAELLERWPAPDAVTLKDILQNYEGGASATDIAMNKDYCSVDGEVNEKYILSDKLWDYLFAYAAKHKAKGNGFGFGMNTPDQTTRTLSARYYKDGSEILINRGEDNNPRRLTPRECARLMGYEDDFIIPVSDTQAYKQFGNSVVAKVVAEVAGIMKNRIDSLVAEERKRGSLLVSGANQGN